MPLPFPEPENFPVEVESGQEHPWLSDMVVDKIQIGVLRLLSFPFNHGL